MDHLQIKNCVANDNKDIKKISKLINYSKNKNQPVAILIKKNVLSTVKKLKNINKDEKNFYSIKRADFLKILLENLKKKDKVISSTGYISRELNQLRKYGKYGGTDFYMVGGMGHTSMVSLGASISSKNKVLCLDGDGSLLMHLGSLSLVGDLSNKNLKYILLNNFSHESVGGQPCVSEKINFKLLSKSMGFKNYMLVNHKKNLNKQISKILKIKKNVFANIIIKKGSITNLGRPRNLYKIKKEFMKDFK